MPSDVMDAPRTAAEAAKSTFGPRLGTVPWLTKSGFHTIAYTEWGDEDATRVAMCVHGLTRQGRDFDPLALALAQRGYRVFCPDLPGRGRSDWLADPAEYDLPQYVAAMATVLARSGANEIDWIGTSLGGLVGIQMASMRGAPFRRMVINDIGPFLPSLALTRLGRYVGSMPKSFANFYAAEAYFREILGPYGILGDSEWFHLTRYSIARREDGSYRLLVDPEIARVFQNVWLYNMSMWRQWDAIRSPVLIVRGEHSDLLTRELTREMLRRGPRTKLIEFPDCGHAPALLDQRQMAPIVHWLTRDETE